MYRDNPLMNIENIFEDLMYAGCPLGRDIGGTPEHVMSFKRPDVMTYRDKYYTASNMTIVVAGNIGEHVKQWIEEYFGQENNTGKPSRAFTSAVFGGVKDKRLIVQEKKLIKYNSCWGGLDFTTRPRKIRLSMS